MIKLLTLIRDTIGKARQLQNEKHHAGLTEALERLNKSEADNKELSRLCDSAQKMHHFQDRAMSRMVKDAEVWMAVKNELHRCMEKYEKVDYKTLIKDHYECE